MRWYKKEVSTVVVTHLTDIWKESNSSNPNWGSVITTEVFEGFTHSLQAHSGRVP
jgi:hypothetical protein